MQHPSGAEALGGKAAGPLGFWELVAGRPSVTQTMTQQTQGQTREADR